MAEQQKRMKQCPMCDKDMEVGGVCATEDCGFDDGDAERRARGQAYINIRSREIEADMEKKRKDKPVGRKKGGFFS
jgi:hypothetical protein